MCCHHNEVGPAVTCPVEDASRHALGVQVRPGRHGSRNADRRHGGQPFGGDIEIKPFLPPPFLVYLAVIRPRPAGPRVFQGVVGVNLSQIQACVGAPRDAQRQWERPFGK